MWTPTLERRSQGQIVVLASLAFAVGCIAYVWVERGFVFALVLSVGFVCVRAALWYGNRSAERRRTGG